MKTAPELMPTSVGATTMGGIAYRIEGELVPALHCRMDGSMPIYFEHHIVFWKSPETNITLRARSGFIKRMLVSMPVLLLEANGSGDIAFSRNAAGHIIAYPLHPGETLLVRENQWLGATGNIDFEPSHIKGWANNILGGNGFWQYAFTNRSKEEGMVWLHGYGNVFKKVLAEGEMLDVEPGAWIYHTPTVVMRPRVYGLRTAILAGNDQLFFNQFQGPGEIGLQSMYSHPLTAEEQNKVGRGPVYSSERGN